MNKIMVIALVLFCCVPSISLASEEIIKCLIDPKIEEELTTKPKIFSACFNGNLERVKFLLKTNSPDLSVKGGVLRTLPLATCAGFFQYLTVVKELADSGYDTQYETIVENYTKILDLVDPSKK